MKTVDVRTSGKLTGSPRRDAVNVGAKAARRYLGSGTRVRVRLLEQVEVAEGRGVALVPYFAKTVRT